MHRCARAHAGRDARAAAAAAAAAAVVQRRAFDIDCVDPSLLECSSASRLEDRGFSPDAVGVSARALDGSESSDDGFGLRRRIASVA